MAVMICEVCSSEVVTGWACHECSRRSLMRRYPPMLPESLVDQLYLGLAKHLINRGDKASNRAFLDAWQNGRKKSEGIASAPAHGLHSRQLIEEKMRDVWAARKAEASRLATLF